MGCACKGKRKTTGWGSGTARLDPTPPTPRKEEVENGPTTLTFADGSTETYSTRMEAHIAKIRAGGGTLSPAE